MRGKTQVLFTREASSPSSGQVPGSRVDASLPTFPGSPEWAAPFQAPDGAGSPATVAGRGRPSTLLPSYPPEAGGTLRYARSLTAGGGRCQPAIGVDAARRL